MGTPEPSSQSEKLSAYAERVRSSPHNLLSARGVEELEDRHIPEAVAFASTLPAGPRMLDIGSGGGLPGLVVAIVRPDLRVELMDATGKKSAFLREAARALALDVEVHHGRAEDLAKGDLAGAFDIVTARAVASLDRLIPWAAPFLRPGGTLHAIKGERWRDELRDAARAMRASGMALEETPVSSGQVEDDGHMPSVVVLRRSSEGRAARA